MLSLSIKEKNGEEKQLVFDSEEVTIGRAPGNDIVLPRNNISRRHARLVDKHRKVVIVDLRSANGTYVNGRRITAPELLTDSDKIYIGDFVIQLVEAETGANVAANTVFEEAPEAPPRMLRSKTVAMSPSDLPSLDALAADAKAAKAEGPPPLAIAEDLGVASDEPPSLEAFQADEVAAPLDEVALAEVAPPPLEEAFPPESPDTEGPSELPPSLAAVIPDEAEVALLADVVASEPELAPALPVEESLEEPEAEASEFEPMRAEPLDMDPFLDEDEATRAIAIMPEALSPEVPESSAEDLGDEEAALQAEEAVFQEEEASSSEVQPEVDLPEALKEAQEPDVQPEILQEAAFEAEEPEGDADGDDASAAWEAWNNAITVVVRQIESDDELLETVSETVVAEQIEYLIQRGALEAGTDRAALIEDVLIECLHYGPMTELMHDESIQEVVANGPSELFYKAEGGGFVKTGRNFATKGSYLRILGRILGGDADSSEALLGSQEARLPDGSRARVVGLASNEAYLLWERGQKVQPTLHDLEESQSLPGDVHQAILQAIKAGENLTLLSSRGKSRQALVSAILGAYGKDKRVLVVETGARLDCPQENVLRLNGAQFLSLASAEDLEPDLMVFMGLSGAILPDWAESALLSSAAVVTIFDGQDLAQVQERLALSLELETGVKDKAHAVIERAFGFTLILEDSEGARIKVGTFPSK